MSRNLTFIDKTGSGDKKTEVEKQIELKIDAPAGEAAPLELPSADTKKEEEDSTP